MKHHKSRTKEPPSLEDVAFEQEIHELADAIAESESASKEISPVMDPFEGYLNTMRTKILANPHIFRSRLSKGYHVLLHELEHPGSSE